MAETGDAADAPIQPGEFGAPCASNADCLSGFCVEGAQGFVCTKLCIEEGDCPGDYSCKGLTLGGDICASPRP